MNAATILRDIAKDMDADYDRLARVQHRDELGRLRGANGRSEGEIQVGGRLDVLAWWACKIRCVADGLGKGDQER